MYTFVNFKFPCMNWGFLGCSLHRLFIVKQQETTLNFDNQGFFWNQILSFRIGLLVNCSEF